MFLSSRVIKERERDSKRRIDHRQHSCRSFSNCHGNAVTERQTQLERERCTCWKVVHTRGGVQINISTGRKEDDLLKF